jgi:hypothetical protein
MKKILFFILCFCSTQIMTAQYEDDVPWEEDYVKLTELIKDKPYSEELVAHFEKMTTNKIFIQYKGFWDILFYGELQTNGNFLNALDNNKIVKILLKEENKLMFYSWYGEEEMLNQVHVLLGAELWKYNGEEKIIKRVLSELMKDEIQVEYISSEHMLAYCEEMSIEHKPKKRNFEDFLNQRLDKAKSKTEKAKAYKDAARFANLMGGDLLMAEEWALKAKVLKADKEIYLLLSALYKKLADTEEN